MTYTHNKTYEKKKQPYIKLDLTFFSGEKTEQATPQKRKKAREEGQVAKSQEIPTAMVFAVMFSALGALTPYMYEKIANIFIFSMSLLEDWDKIFTEQFIPKLMVYIFSEIILIVMPLLMVALVTGLVANLIQVGWHPTTKPLKPKFSKLNPLQGFKRMFSSTAVVELIKSLAKFTIIIMVVLRVLEDNLRTIFLVHQYRLPDIVNFFAGVALDVGMSVATIYAFLAIVDFIFQKWKHSKDLKMSKQDIKEEYKQTEGNPQIKGRIRQKMREAAMRRMMGDVPSADVIVTNPTHYAVAIKYDQESGAPPKVVAKGVDHLAQRIKEVAGENDVEIVENKPLARALYANVEIGYEIPPDMYKAVAEVLAYVYKLKNKI